MRLDENNLILNTGAKMPMIGLGTWKSPADKAGEAVKFALTEGGYNHIDCAAIYRNEKEIGSAFKEVFGDSKRKREDVFITSKLWNTEHQPKAVSKACQATLADLDLEYLDLYLMHWGVAAKPDDEPGPNSVGREDEELDENGILVTEKVSIQETWEAMEGLVKKGMVRAIGVANFTAPMILDLLTYAKIPPAVNQIELHPYLQQTELVEFCQAKNIVVTAYSPLGTPGNSAEKGLPVLLEDEKILEIAKSHGKSPAQVLLRWGIQRQTIVIPKSVTGARINENIAVFDFELSEKEMVDIVSLNRNLRFVNPSDWWKIPYFS